MTNNTGLPSNNDQIPENALSVYGREDALDDFPVLKAFQQYIDAEQSKARKRMVSLCIFFAVLMFVVISAFVAMLMYTSEKKNELYDRLIDIAMKDRSAQQQAAVVQAPVVQQPQQPSQEAAAITALTAKLDEMQKKLVTEQEKAVQAAQAAAQAQAAALRAKEPTPEEIEIKKLKALLAEEKEKVAAEKEKQRKAELEAYHRRYHPDAFEPKTRKAPVPKKPVRVREIEEEDDEEGDDDEKLDALLDGLKDIKPTKDEPVEAAAPKAPSAAPKAPSVSRKPEVQKESSIPVDVGGSSSSWSIPAED